MDERLKRQLDFALEIDKEKNILRQTHLSEHGRRENDAEHAWHMAIMALPTIITVSEDAMRNCPRAMRESQNYKLFATTPRLG